MFDFFVFSLIWILAIYGLIEILKTIWYSLSFSKIKAMSKKDSSLYVIIAAKNKEDDIEVLVRNIMFKYIYGKEENISNIFLCDLNSKDNTKEIMKKIHNDYEELKVINKNELKDFLDNVENIEVGEKTNGT